MHLDTQKLHVVARSRFKPGYLLIVIVCPVVNLANVKPEKRCCAAVRIRLQRIELGACK